MTLFSVRKMVPKSNVYNLIFLCPAWYSCHSRYINRPMFTVGLSLRCFIWSCMMSNHMQKPTTSSLTDTVVDRHDGHERPHITSAFSGSNEPSPTCVDSAEDLRRHKSVSTKSPEPAHEMSAIPSRSDFPSRTLIVCFDGTGDQFDDDNSNVVKFVSLLKKDVPSKQMVYYQVRLTETTIQ